MDLARLFGETAADVIGILRDLLAELADRGEDGLLPRIDRGQGHALPRPSAGNRGRHDRLLDLDRAAHRARVLTSGGGISGDRGEPRLELMLAVAAECVTDHGATDFTRVRA